MVQCRRNCCDGIRKKNLKRQCTKQMGCCVRECEREMSTLCDGICIDRFCSERETYIPFRNRGMYFGEGIFETMRRKRKHKFLQKHLWRLISSAAYFSIPVSYSLDELRTIIIELLQKNSLTDAIVV